MQPLIRRFLSEPGEVKHLSTRRKRDNIVIPLVAASEEGLGQTVIVLVQLRGCRVTIGFTRKVTNFLVSRMFWKGQP